MILSILNDNLFHDGDLKLVHLMMYMKLMLTRLLIYTLNNVKSYTLLNAQILNLHHKIGNINFI
jgi:hypothetical protein